VHVCCQSYAGFDDDTLSCTYSSTRWQECFNPIGSSPDKDDNSNPDADPALKNDLVYENETV